MNHLKLAAGSVAILSLLSVFAIGRSPPPGAAQPEPFTKVWNEAATSVALKNADASGRMVLEANAAPREVPLVKIELPSKIPEAVALPDPPSAKKQKLAQAESNLCTRNGMQKVWVNKYKWRCRK